MDEDTPLVSFDGMTLDDAIDKLLALRDRATAHKIEASRCHTRADFDRARHAEDAFWSAQDAFREAFDGRRYAYSEGQRPSRVARHT